MSCIWRVDINWIEMFLGVILNFQLIASWWYMVFSKQWMRSIGKTEKEIDKNRMGKCMVIELIQRFVFVLGFYHLIIYFNSQSLCDYLLLSTWLGLAQIILHQMRPVLWEYKPISYVIVTGTEKMLSLYLTAIYFYLTSNYQLFDRSSAKQVEIVANNLVAEE